MNEFLEALGLFFRDMFYYALIAILLENTVFTRGLGTSTALFATRKKHDVFLLGSIMTVLVAASALILYFIFPHLRSLQYSYYIIPPVYVLIVGAVYAIALLIKLNDNKVNCAEDVEKYLGLSVLGEIPTFSGATKIKKYY